MARAQTSSFALGILVLVFAGCGGRQTSKMVGSVVEVTVSQNAYIIDKTSHSCFLLLPNSRGIGSIDCHVLKDVSKEAAAHIEWPKPNPFESLMAAFSESAQASASAEKKRPVESTWDGIEKTKATTWIVPREKVENLNATDTRQARIVPSIRNGAPNGFKLYAIRPTSIFYAIGLQNGDTIVALNDMPITSVDGALEVYEKIKTASEIKVDIERRGRKIRHFYQIKD